MELQRVHESVRAAGTVPSRVRSTADYAFEILGSPAVCGIDIASVFAEASARMGDSVWVGYVPVAGRLTCRVRLSRTPIHSGGDGADLVLVLDPQLFRRRLSDETLAPHTHVLIDSELLHRKFNAEYPVYSGVGQQEASGQKLQIQPLPLRALATKIPTFAHGERLVALGVLAWLYRRHPDTVRKLLENELASAGGRTVSDALRLFEFGWREAPRLVGRRFDVTPPPATFRRREVMDGRRALVLGALAAGMTRCRAAASHPLVDGFARVFEARGGQIVVGEETTNAQPTKDQKVEGPAPETQATETQAPETQTPENKTTGEQTTNVYTTGAHTTDARDAMSRNVAPLLTIEAAGCPLDSELGGESSGGTTDLYERDRHTADLSGSRPARVIIRLERLVPGNEPMFPAWFDRLGPTIGCGPGATTGSSSSASPMVLAPTSVEECFHFVGLAARVASEYRRDTIVLVDALLLGAVQGWVSTKHAEGNAASLPFHPEAVAPSGDAGPRAFGDAGPRAFGDPGRRAFEDSGRRAVDELFERLELASAPLETFTQPAPVVGGDEGDVLLVGWGATRGPIEEAVGRLRAEGMRVSSLHLRTLHPLPSNIVETLTRFRHVVTVDVLTDRYDAEARLGHLTAMLRAAVATHARNGASATPAVRLSTYAFSHERPLGPAAVREFVRFNLHPGR